jgi:hypothetical protein
MQQVNTPDQPRRLVISVLDPEPVSWQMPAAEPHQDTFIAGGFRTLHELAVAASATGRTVELRGPVSIPVLDELAGAAGARPELPETPRRPGEGDIVVVLGGGSDVLRFARLVLSPARFVLALLAPPGLTGWPFVAGWEIESYLSVDPASVARPEHFRAMAAMGVDLWTHMPRVQKLASEAGARCSFIGNGDPLPFETSQIEKDLPAVYLEANGWSSLAHEAAGLMRTTVTAIPDSPHERVIEMMARARVLLWPARVTGHGRVLWEARSQGTVVVGLESNIYATGLDEGSGAVAVSSVREMAAVAEDLLGSPERLRSLSEAGRRSAREQVEWPRYVERVDAAIAAVEGREQDAGAGARAVIGERLCEMLDERLVALDRVVELDGVLAEAAARVRVLDDQLAAAARVIGELDPLTSGATGPRVSQARSLHLLGELRRRVVSRLVGLRP